MSDTVAIIISISLVISTIVFTRGAYISIKTYKKKRNPPQKEPFISPFVSKIIESMEYCPEEWGFCRLDYLRRENPEVEITKRFEIFRPVDVIELNEDEKTLLESAYKIMKSHKNPEKIKQLISELDKRIEQKRRQSQGKDPQPNHK